MHEIDTWGLITDGSSVNYLPSGARREFNVERVNLEIYVGVPIRLAREVSDET